MSVPVGFPVGTLLHQWTELMRLWGEANGYIKN